MATGAMSDPCSGCTGDDRKLGHSLGLLAQGSLVVTLHLRGEKRMFFSCKTRL